MDLDAELPSIIAGDADAFGRWLAGAERPVRESLRSFAAVIDAEAVLQEALLRVWQVAPRFQPDGRRPRRTLKTLLQESGIPPWERERLPLLYCGGKLVAVPGIGVAAGAAAAPGERAWTVSWAPDRPKLPKPAKAMIK